MKINKMIEALEEYRDAQDELIAEAKELRQKIETMEAENKAMRERVERFVKLRADFMEECKKYDEK